MLEYQYTLKNQLQKPCNYMYTPYLGKDFISLYFNNRISHLNRFSQMNKNKFDKSEDSNLFNSVYKKLVFLLDKDLKSKYRSIFTCQDETIEIDIDTQKGLGSFNIEEKIETRQLLVSLLYSQLYNCDFELEKKILDLLLQRFEVTKKIHSSYLNNLSKGYGEFDALNLYCFFALSLTLQYAKTKNIKYLNTILKLSDFLCSIRDNFNLSSTFLRILSLVILFEMSSILLALKKSGVKYDFK